MTKAPERSGAFVIINVISLGTFKMKYHAVAYLSGGKQKTIVNKSEDQIFADVVLPFVASGVFSAKWGDRNQTYNVLELRIYQTKASWDRKDGVSFADFIKSKRNVYDRFQAKANERLAINKFRVFMVTPIQGSKHGDQEQQRISREFDERFATVEQVVNSFGGIAIRIDREHPLEDLVTRIKKEINSSTFIIADLTDERPSCYFEAGYAEALRKPVIYVASNNSVIKPGTPTKIHFDVHMNILFFSNHAELGEKLTSSIERNKNKLIDGETQDQW